MTGYPHFLFGRNAAATHADGATAHCDVVQVEAVLAVGGEEFGIGLEVDRVIGVVALVDCVIDEPQRLRPRLVEIAVGAVSPEHIGQFENR